MFIRFISEIKVVSGFTNFPESEARNLQIFQKICQNENRIV